MCGHVRACVYGVFGETAGRKGKQGRGADARRRGGRRTPEQNGIERVFGAHACYILLLNDDTCRLVRDSRYYKWFVVYYGAATLVSGGTL